MGIHRSRNEFERGDVLVRVTRATARSLRTTWRNGKLVSRSGLNGTVIRGVVLMRVVSLRVVMTRVAGVIARALVCGRPGRSLDAFACRSRDRRATRGQRESGGSDE